MPDIYNNKVVLADGTVLIDLTATIDDLTAYTIPAGFHDVAAFVVM